MIQTPTAHDSGCGCGECTSGKRNRFFRGKTMRAEEFQIEQEYAIERRRLLNRSIAGWGVVYGFSLKQPDPPDPKTFTVGAGLALDRHGREIDLRRPLVLDRCNTSIVEHAGDGSCRVRGLNHVDRRWTYVLLAHYAERRFADAASLDECGCDPPEKKFLCETVAFSLTRLDGPCPCEECRCRRKCSCLPSGHDSHADEQEKEEAERLKVRQNPAQQGGALDYRGEELGDEDRDERECERAHREARCGSCGRGPHACLCEWVEAIAPPDDDGKLCEWKDGGVWIDPRDGVALACVRIWPTDDECHPYGFEVTEACDPRRLVKSNDLLYDLVRGCDLTRIRYVSWWRWHRSGDSVEWDQFAGMFDAASAHPKGAVRTRFVIRFSDPVLVETARRRDTVVMTAITVEQNSAWRIPRRVPIVRIDTTPTRPLPDHLTDQLRLYVDHRWYRDEVDMEAQSWLSRAGFVVEIEIRGDLILDCHHQTVDANAVGLAAVPTGNGTPGGTYVSSFWVKPKPDTHRWDETETA